MSKKDKKRIAKLEQQQAILAVRLATSKANFNQLVYSDYDLYNRYRAAQGLPELSQSGFEQIKPDYIFKAGTIPSEKEQEKTEQPVPILNEKMRESTVCAGRSWGKFVSFEVDEEYIKTALSRLEKEQGKTEQPQQSEVQKEQELMEELNKELAKFASLEAFNADRKNRFLPPVGKLEFHKMKSAIECTFAIAKMVRPELFDQIDQIKIPKEGQGETEQIEPKFSNESIIPKFPDGAKVHYFGTSGREDFTTLHHIVLRYKDIFDAQLSIKGLTNLELIKQVDKMAVLFRNELHELMQSETNKGKEGRGETKQSQPENHRKNLGEPILNKPQSKEEKRANRINAALKMAVEDLYKHLNFTLQNFGKDRAKQVEMLQDYCDHFKQDLSDFRRKVLSVSDLGGVKENEAILPAPEEKEAEQSETEPTETADASAGKDGWAYAILASDEKDKPRLYVSKYAVWNGNEMKPVNHAWRIETTPNKAEAFQCNNLEIARREIENMKLHGADKGNQFGACNLRPVLICTDENAANFNKPDGSELHKSDSKDLGGADGADSPTRTGYSYIVIVNHKQGGVPLYLLDFEQTSCDGVPDMSIETTYTKQRAYKFDHIKQAQNFIDLTIECDAHKGYNFFIDTLQ